VPDRELQEDTDAIVRVDTTTICGTDLHIVKGDTPEVTAGRILGHEAVGTVEKVGTGVKTLAPGTGSSFRASLPARAAGSAVRVASVSASAGADGSSGT